MSEFQPAAPPVPRTSKQAKMLGVGVDDLPYPSPSPRTAYGPSPVQSPLASGSQSQQQQVPPTGMSGLEGWNGWAAPHVAAAGASAAAVPPGAPLNRVESGVSPFASSSNLNASTSRASLEVSVSPSFPVTSRFGLTKVPRAGQAQGLCSPPLSYVADSEYSELERTPVQLGARLEPWDIGAKTWALRRLLEAQKQPWRAGGR